MIGPAFNLQSQATIDDGRATLASTIIQLVRIGLVHRDVLQEEAIETVRRRYPNLRI